MYLQLENLSQLLSITIAAGSTSSSNLTLLESRFSNRNFTLIAKHRRLGDKNGGRKGDEEFLYRELREWSFSIHCFPFYRSIMLK